jgi:hypothetical protein
MKIELRKMMKMKEKKMYEIETKVSEVKVKRILGENVDSFFSLTDLQQRVKNNLFIQIKRKIRKKV